MIENLKVSRAIDGDLILQRVVMRRLQHVRARERMRTFAQVSALHDRQTGICSSCCSSGVEACAAMCWPSALARCCCCVVALALAVLAHQAAFAQALAGYRRRARPEPLRKA